MFVSSVFSALRRVSSCVLAVATLSLSACKDDDDHAHHPAVTSQPLTLEFEHHGSDDQPLIYGRQYRTAAGEPYTIDSLKYYVSNLKLTRADGTIWTAPPAYYLMRTPSAPAANVKFTIPAVPLGTYSKVTFSVGVDSIRNHTGDQPGVLSPNYQMLWSWATGYKFLALDGHYQPATAPIAPLFYHLGGDAVYRPMTVTLSLPEPATVTANIAPAAHLTVDVNALFGGPNRADLTDAAQLVVMGANARIAANVPDMFRVELSTTTRSNIPVRLRLLLLALGAALAPRVAEACDICGCFMGVLPYDNQSSLSILHRYRVYHGYTGQPHHILPAGSPGLLRTAHDGHEHSATPTDPTDFEIYRTTDLRARYFLGRRLETSVYVPVVRITPQTSGLRQQITGLSDITWLVGYHVVRRIDVPGVQQRLLIGVGLKLPTGAANRRTAAGTRYGLTEQPGTGTFDQLVWATYLAGYRRAGLSLTATGKRTGRNHWGESIAPAVTGYVTLFYTVALGADWRILPNVQGYYEYTDGQTLDGALIGAHARREALLGPGIDVFWRNVSVSASAQRAAWQPGSAEHTQSAGRVMLGLTYSFKQTRFVLGRGSE